MQAAIHRRMSGDQRLRLACEMSDAARELALTRLRETHPDWTSRQMVHELLRSAFLPHPLPPDLD